MRTVASKDIIGKVKKMIISVNFDLDAKTLKSLKDGRKQEVTEMGKYVLDEIVENAEIAKREKIPLCQDTGVCVFFVRWGQECVLKGMSLQETLDQAVREAYQEGYLRKSILQDPLFNRQNTGDNTPAVIHVELVPGNRVEIEFLAKGAGADNASKMTMLIPAQGIDGVIDYVLQVCQEAGATSCPPWILGIGIGGTFDSVGSLAKQAMLRPIGSKHPDPNYDQLEKTILKKVNHLGVGPQGLGGKISALACFIEARSSHAATIPVAVNIQCHSNRKGRVKL
jgi:fumarate hydratase subunit alpha